MLTDSEITELADELTTDPDGLGYADADGLQSNAELGRLLNEVRPEYTVWRPRVEGRDIVGATVPDEWTALDAQERERFMALTGASGGVDTSSQHVRTAFARMFGPDTTTRANLIDLAQRNASRAEALFGEGTSVTLEDIRAAREV